METETTQQHFVLHAETAYFNAVPVSGPAPAPKPETKEANV